jgi:alcohol dehydrogenase (cytochrome c)
LNEKAVKRKFAPARLLPVILLAAANTAIAAGPSQAELDDLAGTSGNWLYVDHDYHGTRYSPLDQINAGNVQGLARVCSYTFPEKEPSQTAPLAYAGIVYATTAHYTVALDGTSCRVIWRHQWRPRDREVVTTQRGAALKDGRVVRGTADGFLIALDAQTGKEIWVRQIADPTAGYFFSVAPLIVDDLVIIGPAGSEWASKGWVGAFKLSNGERVWKFNTVPDLGEAGADTWGQNAAALRTGGGSIWTPMSYDEEKGLVYVPVGNPAPDFYDNDRPGINLYTGSVIALNLRTGRLAWHFQGAPHDQRDYDLTHASPMFDAVAAGRPRKVMAITGKDGLLRLLDRDTQETIYNVPFTTRLNSEGPIGTEFVHICPGTVGGHEWNGSAFDPKLNSLFVPATDWCGDVRRSATRPKIDEDNTKGPFYFGGDGKFGAWTEASGWLTAFDASTGQQKWRYHARKPMIGGVLATAGGLVFTGELDGTFEAFDARGGKVLFSSNVGGPIGGGVVSYSGNGKQCVAVVSGFVGLYNQVAPELGGGNPTITVFALK